MLCWHRRRRSLRSWQRLVCDGCLRGSTGLSRSRMPRSRTSPSTADPQASSSSSARSSVAAPRSPWLWTCSPLLTADGWRPDLVICEPWEFGGALLAAKLGGWCSTGVYGGGRDPLGGRERFNGWSPLSILLLAVGFEGCGELLVAVGGCLGPCRRPWGSHRWVNSG